MISIIVPAHNEEAVIARCLSSLLDGARPGEIEIVVVCNGCRDATAAVARGFGEAVRVIETDVPSKSNALNLGDQAARGFPRLYVDADVVLKIDAVRRIAEALARPGIFAAAPAVRNEFMPGTSWSVRAYYDFWMSLPYVREGMMAAGAYAMNRAGRGRFDAFPPVIADDGFVRLLFSADERVEVASAVSVVRAPSTLRDLVKIKTRSRLGFFELRERFPDHFHRESGSKQYGRAVLELLARPRMWSRAVPYLWVNFLSRWRATRQRRATRTYVWERDDSSRTPPPRHVGKTAAESSRLSETTAS